MGRPLRHDRPARSAATATSGFAAGVGTATVNLGIVAGPPLFGVAVDATGSYGLPWMLLAGAAAITAVCFLFVHEPEPA